MTKTQFFAFLAKNKATASAGIEVLHSQFNGRRRIVLLQDNVWVRQFPPLVQEINNTRWSYTTQDRANAEQKADVYRRWMAEWKTAQSAEKKTTLEEKDDRPPN